jgi:hypothetical protein
VALQHRPTANSGRANGWRTIGGMWTDHVRSYTTPTLALGPQLWWGLAEGVDFTAKYGRNLTRPSYLQSCVSSGVINRGLLS